MSSMSPMTSSICLAALLALLMTPISFAQKQAEIPLWPNGAPGATGSTPKDIPTITPYLSDSAVPGGATVIILPGGGYSALAAHEGNDFAVWLGQHGLTTFVLKYRLGSAGYHYPIEINDGARAVRWVRAHADEYKIDPKRVAIMGSSAGGHLASAILTHFDAGDPAAADPIDKFSDRPDFGILCYAVITMGTNTHAGSKKNLLGDNPSDDLVKEMSSELHVTAQTPPCFIWAGVNDKTVPVQNSIDFAMALKQNNVPFDLHLYQNAPHGLGLGDKVPPFAHPLPWTGDFLLWLKTNKLITPDMALGSAAPTTAPATMPAMR